jgi:hypothetical protein
MSPENHMLKTSLSVLALTAAFLSPGAQAQSEADKRLEELRISSEQMKPTTNPPLATRGPAGVERPQSAEEKRLNEIRIGSEQMKPATSERFERQATARPEEAKSPAALELDAIRESSEQMKPR